MKKLLITTLTVSAVLLNCAPKENNIGNTTPTNRPQRGTMIHNQQPAMPGQQGLQRGTGQDPAQQTSATAPGEAVNLLRFSKDVGFYSLNDKRIPQAVQKAAASVFHLVMFTATAGESSYIVEKKSELALKQQGFKDNVNKNTSYNNFEKVGLIEQLNGCLKYAKDEDNCVIMKSTVHATAFLSGDSSTLLTNSHAIEDYLNSLMILEKKTLAEVTDKSNKLLIFIYDQNNRLVFNPYDQQIMIENLPVATAASAKSKKFYGVDNDYVQLRVSVELGNPLVWAAKGAEINRAAYSIGYPDCTGCEIRAKDPSESMKLNFADRSPKTNAKEFEVMATIGSVIFPDDGVLGFLNIGPQDRAAFGKNVVFFTGDSQHGMSGGPILDEKGEVIAVLAMAKSRKIKDQFFHLSSGVVPPKYLVE